MAYYIQSEGSSSEQEMCPEGVIQGVVSKFVPQGLQPPYKPGEKAKRKCSIVVTLNALVTSGSKAGEHHKVTITMTETMHESGKMAKIYMALMPELTLQEMQRPDFDLERIVGRNGMFPIIHTEKKNGGGTTYKSLDPRPLTAGMTMMAPNPNVEIPDWLLEAQAQRLDSQPIDPMMHHSQIVTLD